MMNHLKYTVVGLCGLLTLSLLSSCDNFMGIDDDLSDCGKNFNLDYRIRLITNKDTEIQTVFNSEKDVYVAKAVDKELSEYFREYAKNLDLAFYHIDKDALELNEVHAIEGNQASYTFYLEHDKYHHLTIGNIDQESSVELTGNNNSATSRLVAKGGETLQNHHVALFTGREELDASGQKELNGHVDLYMANSAAVMVIDTTGYEVKNIRVSVEDVATSFNIADSTYLFGGGSIEAIKLDLSSYPDNKREAYYTYCFPSRDQATEEEGAIWRMKVYVTLTDGSVTENVLSIHEPLKAGNVEIFKSIIDDKGVLLIADASVGVSVTLNWKPGGSYTPDL